MNEKEKKSVLEVLRNIYEDEFEVHKAIGLIEEKFETHRGTNKENGWLTEKDSILITYGDTVQSEDKAHLRTLHDFLLKYVGQDIPTVHILPMYPYTSDDGFSVIDYKAINPELGTWNDINNLAEDYSLMFDAVINHISKSSEWFQKFLACEEPYKNYFITADPKDDYSKVIRPRALPLLTPFETKEGIKHVWTTFSDDQIDLNFENIDLLIEILDVLITYANNGAKFIRLDAIGFLWKEKGTSCMNLEKAHQVIKLIRKVLDIYVPGTIIITETNVPHKDNISYFGNGDEAQLVYQFSLPPLTMFSLLKGDATKLTNWAKSLEILSPYTTYFNFLSSHDGIGLRPTEGILTDEERKFLVDTTLRNGGEVSYRNNGDGTVSPYELNINYQDALASVDDSDETRVKRFMAAETILLSLQGLPGIYIHSLLGSRNDYYGKNTSKIPRRINREKLDLGYLEESLSSNTNRNIIFNEMLKRLRIRKQHSAFSPAASQEILELDKRVFALVRQNRDTEETIYAIVNVSGEDVTLCINGLNGVDLISDIRVENTITLKALDTMWIQAEQKL
jgi:sucrose phosphorylase